MATTDRPQAAAGEAGVRLLPWSSPDGKPCYVSTDGAGPVTRVADHIESAQLAMAVQLLGHAADMLPDHRTTATQLRFLAARMAETLHDVHRIAESRGARLPAPGYDVFGVGAEAEPVETSG
jgi:hypothetical protein